MSDYRHIAVRLRARLSTDDVNRRCQTSVLFNTGRVEPPRSADDEANFDWTTHMHRTVPQVPDPNDNSNADSSGDCDLWVREYETCSAPSTENPTTLRQRAVDSYRNRVSYRRAMDEGVLQALRDTAAAAAHEPARLARVASVLVQCDMAHKSGRSKHDLALNEFLDLYHGSNGRDHLVWMRDVCTSLDACTAYVLYCYARERARGNTAITKAQTDAVLQSSISVDVCFVIGHTVDGRMMRVFLIPSADSEQVLVRHKQRVAAVCRVLRQLPREWREAVQRNTTNNPVVHKQPFHAWPQRHRLTPPERLRSLLDQAGEYQRTAGLGRQSDTVRAASNGATPGSFYALAIAAGDRGFAPNAAAAGSMAGRSSSRYASGASSSHTDATFSNSAYRTDRSSIDSSIGSNSSLGSSYSDATSSGSAYHTDQSSIGSSSSSSSNSSLGSSYADAVFANNTHPADRSSNRPPGGASVSGASISHLDAILANNLRLDDQSISARLAAAASRYAGSLVGYGGSSSSSSSSARRSALVAAAQDYGRGRDAASRSTDVYGNPLESAHASSSFGGGYASSSVFRPRNSDGKRQRDPDDSEEQKKRNPKK